MKTTLYIINNASKEQMLKKTKSLMNNKYMTIEDLKKTYLFDYDDEAIYYIMKTKNVKYDIAKNYIENMYLTWNSDIEDDKVRFLKSLYFELKEKKLLIQNPLFKEYLKNVSIIVKGYLLSKYDRKILDSVSEITSVQIEKENNCSYIPKVYEFKMIEEEVVFVASCIKENLKSNNIKNIKISFTSEYEYLIRTIFNMFHLPLNNKSNSILYGNTVCKEWIASLKKTKDSVKTSEEMIEKYDYIAPIQKLIDITNKIPEEIVDDTYLEYFISMCKNVCLPIDSNGIECISFLSDSISDNDIVYLLGCNTENISKTYKDEDYLSDKTKQQLGIDTSLDKNILEKKKWLQKIKNTKNLTLTYKLKTPFESYTKSPLLNEFTVERKIKDSYLYSNLYNQITLGKKLDKLIKYNEKDNDLDILSSTYPNSAYRTYENKFSGIDKKDIKSFLNDKVHLSYTSMNNYYLCGFKYYVGSLLKLDIYEETFMTQIGNLYHYVLSKSVEENFDFDLEYESYLKNKEWSNKEKFFLTKLKEELKFVIETISYQNRFTNLKSTLCEEKMYVNPNSKIIFNGIVDKIMYKEENGKKIVAIVDYKTGTPETNIMNIPYGLEMQLPVYVYLLKHNPEFRKSKIVGFYLQKILNKDFSYDGVDYNREKRKLLRLDGYSINNEELLSEFDTTYQDSEMIRGMKIGKNGFYSYAKTISEEQIEHMSNLVEEKIIECADNILNGNFTINPKRIDGGLIGCKYCKFKDICYKTENDIVDLEKINNLDFLRGE